LADRTSPVAIARLTDAANFERVARLVVITHEHDLFAWHDPASGGRIGSPYLLRGVLHSLEKLGHDWVLTRGPQRPPGDVALLHVDATVVGDEYLSLRSDYAGSINFDVVDISKRKISRNLLTPADDWAGPVIVKGNLNCGGQMEEKHNRRARSLGLSEPHPGVVEWSDYRILASLGEVEAEVWANPALVVERFVPEPDPDGGFAYRTWVFMGPRERCNRFVTAEPISKGAGILRYEPAEVPESLREERARLGFDIGSFDFVINDGEAVLLDANRTPGVTPTLSQMIDAGNANLAEGLDVLIRERC
jgi:hypothetical protein